MSCPMRGQTYCNNLSFGFFSYIMGLMYQNCLKEKAVLLPIATNQNACFVCLAQFRKEVQNSDCCGQLGTISPGRSRYRRLSVSVYLGLFGYKAASAKKNAYSTQGLLTRNRHIGPHVWRQRRQERPIATNENAAFVF